MVNIPNDDWLSFAYVDERNLCCYGEKGFYFFSAEEYKAVWNYEILEPYRGMILK